MRVSEKLNHDEYALLKLSYVNVSPPSVYEKSKRVVCVAFWISDIVLSSTRCHVPLTVADERAVDDTVMVLVLTVTSVRSAVPIVSSDKLPNDVVPSTMGVTSAEDTLETLMFELAYVK